MLPPFWIPWLLISAACFAIGIRELDRPGIVPGRRSTWTPLYSFCTEYFARLGVVGIFCGWAQFFAWVFS